MGKGGYDRLAVPISDMESFGPRLRSIKNRMNGTKKMFDSYREDIGDSGVCDKLDDFESNWEDGREDISKQVDGLAKMADAVVREFDKGDGKLRDELERSSKKKTHKQADKK